MTRAQAPAGMAVTKLDPNAVYISPTGRRCRWVPFDDRAKKAHAFFEYLDVPRRAVEPEGFTLAPENYRFLKLEVRHAAAR